MNPIENWDAITPTHPDDPTTLRAEQEQAEPAAKIDIKRKSMRIEEMSRKQYGLKDIPIDDAKAFLKLKFGDTLKNYVINDNKLEFVITQQLHEKLYTLNAFYGSIEALENDGLIMRVCDCDSDTFSIDTEPDLSYHDEGSEEPSTNESSEPNNHKSKDIMTNKPESVNNEPVVGNQFFDPRGIPETMKVRPQYVLWKREERDGKATKPPYIVKNGKLVRRKDKNAVYSFEEAARLAMEFSCGIGIVFDPELSPLCGIDIDHCLDEQGNINATAQALLNHVGKTAIEYSPSGNGVHIYFFDDAPERPTKNRKGGIEVYDHGRFFTVTGKPFGAANEVAHLPGMAAEISREFIEKQSTLKAAQSPQKAHKVVEQSQIDETVVPAEIDASDALQPASDISQRIQEVFGVLRRAKDADKFKRLYEGNDNGYHSTSEADLAFFGMLAFYTKKNVELMKAIFKSSARSRRAKAAREDYVDRTIETAISNCTGIYKGKYSWESDGRSRGDDDEAISDYALAELILQSDVGDELRYNLDTSAFMVYNTPIWTTLGETREVRFFIDRYRKSLEPNDAATSNILGNLSSEKKIAKVIPALLNFPSIIVRNDELNQQQYLLNVQNGVVDLRTGKLLTHNPSFLWTRQANVYFDREAHSDIFNNFITSVIADDDTRRALQVFLGYCLTASVEEEKALFVHGGGGNGKGTLFGTMMNLLGNFAVALRIDALLTGKRSDANAASPEFNKLEHARLAVAEEIPPDRKLDVAQYKLLTGGDRLPTRRLYSEATEINPSHKLILSGNRLPGIHDPRDKGILRRLLVVKFRATFDDHNRDPKLKRKLLDPQVLSAFFNWLLEGCRTWQRDGLLISSDMKQDRQDYLEDNDELFAFIEEFCRRDAKAAVPRSELLKAIRDKCNALRNVGDAELTKLLRAIDGIGYKRTTHGYAFTGIKLLTESELNFEGDE